MSTKGGSDKEKVATRYRNDSNNEGHYNNVNLNSSGNCSNTFQQQHPSSRGSNVRNVSPDYDSLADKRQRKQNCFMPDLPTNRHHGLALLQNDRDFDDKEKDKKAESNVNNSTLSLNIQSYENSVEDGDTEMEREDLTKKTSVKKSVTGGIGGLLNKVKDMFGCSDVLIKGHDSQEKLPEVQHFKSSVKLFDPKVEPIVHYCDKCLRFFNLFRDLLLHKCPEVSDIISSDSPSFNNAENMDYVRYESEVEESKHIIETVYDEYVPPREYQLYSRNFFLEKQKNEKKEDQMKSDKINDYANFNDDFAETENLQEATVSVEQKTTQKIVDQQDNANPKIPRKLTGLSSLCNNTDCSKIMNRFAKSKKKGESYTTLAAELSNVLGYNITRFQANHQFKIYIHNNSHNSNTFKQTKIGFKPIQKPNESTTLKRKSSTPMESVDTKISKKKGKDVHDEILQRMHKLEKQNSQILDQNTALLELLSKIVNNGKFNGIEIIQNSKAQNPKKVTFKEENVVLEVNSESEGEIKMNEYEAIFDDSDGSATSDSDAEDDSTDRKSESSSDDASEEDDNKEFLEDKGVASTSDYGNGASVQNKNGQILTEYIFAKNSKLKPMVVIKQNGNLFTYTKKTTKKNTNPPTIYYECNRCPRNASDKSKATMKGDDFWAHPNHSNECQPLTQNEFDGMQIDRNIRQNVTNGFRGLDAYRAGFKEACLKEVKIGDYENLRKSYDRLSGKEIPNSTKNKVAEGHTVLLNGERWLLHEENDLAVFSSDLELRTMAECKILMGDPTFRTSPKGFNQTFYIHGLVEGQSGPEWRCLLMAVMNNKEESTYKTVINVIKKRWKEMGVEPKFERFHTDYESALFNAVAELGGKDKVYGCLFHYDKAVLFNMKKIGLFSYYRLPADKTKRKPHLRAIRKWIRTIMALPMVPKEDILFLWEDLSNIPQKPSDCIEPWPSSLLQEFADYITKNWIPLLLEKDNNRWSFFGLGRTKNTNPCEGYNSGLNQQLPKRPKYKIFLELQKSRFSMNDARIINLQTTTVKPNWLNIKYTEIAKRIQKHEMKLVKLKEQNLSEEELLQALKKHCERVSYELHDVRNKSLNTIKSGKTADGRRKYKLMSDDDDDEEDESDEENEKVKKITDKKKNIVIPKAATTKKSKPQLQPKVTKQNKLKVEKKPIKLQIGWLPQMENIPFNMLLERWMRHAAAVCSDCGNDRIIQNAVIIPPHQRYLIVEINRFNVINNGAYITQYQNNITNLNQQKQQFFNQSWKLIAAAEYDGCVNNGHYRYWKRLEDKWAVVDNDTVSTRKNLIDGFRGYRYFIFERI
uniref:Transposase n=1 Tax=Panagrolaimus sp. ES5 TaxID=591445 RepID=A0AC34EZE9_9BILA